MELSYTVLGLFAAAVSLLAVFWPPHIVLLSAFPLALFPGAWHISGIRFDPTDVALGGLTVALLLRRKDLSFGGVRMKWWILLGLLMSAAYVLAPMNQVYLTDPVRITYQLYRYAWKMVIFFPLALLTMRNEKRVEFAITVLVVTADICALQAIGQGRAGDQATGPFVSWNHLGGFLIAPGIFSLYRVLFPRSRRDFFFSALSFVLICRALLYSGSRGSLAGFLAGTGFLIGLMLLIPEPRRRLLRWTPLALLALLLLLATVSDLTTRPNLRRALTLRNAAEVGTFQWRVTERWPYFFGKAIEHPWFGVGTDVDRDLGRTANTPHNGFLSVALLYGFPVALMYLAFGLTAVWRGVRTLLRPQEVRLRAAGLAVAAALLGLLTHSIVESLLLFPFVANQFWMLCSFALILTRLPEEEARESPPPALRPLEAMARVGT